MNKRKKLNWKKYWFCGIPLFISLIIGSLLTYFLNIPVLFDFVLMCIGAGITFYLVEKYALEDVENER